MSTIKKAKEEGDRLELLETALRVAAVAVAIAQHFRKPRRADVAKSEARHASLEAK